MIKLKKQQKTHKKSNVKVFLKKTSGQTQGLSVLACEGLKNKPKYMGLGLAYTPRSYLFILLQEVPFILKKIKKKQVMSRLLGRMRHPRYAHHRIHSPLW